MNTAVINNEASDWSHYAKKPEIVRGKPNWWHPGGTNVQIMTTSKNSLYLASQSVKISIFKEIQRHGLFLEWSIHPKLNSHVPESHIYQGKMHFDMLTAAAAFGVNDLCHRSSIWIVDNYGATAARQGFFIRYGDYLNIPGPGTGQDGDPNPSLFLEKDVKDWFLSFLPQSHESRQLLLLQK